MNYTETMIKNIDYLLNIEKLNIPIYQRPYEWSRENILELLSDINTAIEKQKQFGNDFRYRIGTIILHKNQENNDYKLDIVDGQQRIISLLLLKKYLDKDFKCNLLEIKFNNKITISNISQNYKYIEDYFAFRQDLKQSFINAFTNLLEVVIIKLCNDSKNNSSENNVSEEAFQLFDSQNSKGKDLEALDLLKAYHLRKMDNENGKRKKNIIKAWNKNKSGKEDKVEELFNIYLFPIYNWSRRIKIKNENFTKDDIDIYKGIDIDSNYSYAKRAKKADGCFQITESFISGDSFFEMVNYYINLLNEIKEKLNGQKYSYITDILNKYGDTYQLKYVKDLFYCAILFYYDRFNNLNEEVVRKLFVWSFMLRTDLKFVQKNSINKYAIGEYCWNHTNQIPIFEKIKYARTEEEIANIEIKTENQNKNTDNNKKWEKLHNDLKKLIK